LLPQAGGLIFTQGQLLPQAGGLIVSALETARKETARVMTAKSFFMVVVSLFDLI
jgi:hypothetical protein